MAEASPSARDAADGAFPWASQPQLLRAAQKDEWYLQVAAAEPRMMIVGRGLLHGSTDSSLRVSRWVRRDYRGRKRIDDERAWLPRSL